MATPQETQALLESYADLLIVQYRGASKNRELVKTLINLFWQNGIYDVFRYFFDIDKASGKHLEILGLYVGAYRTVNGYVLSDEELRLLIKLLSARTGIGATIAEITQLMYNTFGDEALIFNNYDMSVTYFVDAKWQGFFENVLIPGNYLPVPQGIGIKFVAELPSLTKNVFGYADYYDGLNTTVIKGYQDAYLARQPWTYLDSSMLKKLS